MKRLPAIFFAFALAHAQFTVTTVAGGGPAASGLGGGIARDAAGNTYLCGGTIVTRMAPDGTMATYAGTGVAGYSGDGGAAVAAQLGGAYYCATDPAGNLVVSDINNYRIRRIDAKGTITTIAGTGVPGELGDGGAGTAAQIGSVTGIAIDGAGNIYFSDGSYIRRLSAAGIVQRIAGNGGVGSAGDGGPALAASFAEAGSVTLDGAGDIYCIDQNLIRRIGPDGTIVTVAGSLTAKSAAQDGTAATSGYLRSVTALASDAAGNLYAGAGGVIRRVDASTGVISTVAGSPSGTLSQGPALNVYLGTAGTIYADAGGVLWISTTQLQTLANGMVTTVVPYSGFIDPADGAQATAVSLEPASIAVSRSGDLYIGETATCAIRIVGADGRLSTVPGTGNCNATPRIVPGSVVADSKGNVYASDATDSAQSKVYAISPAGNISVVNGLLGGLLAIDSQDRIYEVERNSLKILRVTPGGTAQTVVSSLPSPIGVSGSAAIALDASGNLFIAASRGAVNLGPTSIFRLDSASGQLTPVPGAFANNATSVAIDGSGDFWLIDNTQSLSGTGPELLYQQTGYSGAADGSLLAAGFGGVLSLEAGPEGSIYVLELDCGCVRKISGAPPATAPSIRSAGVANAASFSAGAIAPGELISIFGTNLGAAAVEPFRLTNNSVPTVLDDIEVLINNAPAPIMAVSPDQINVFVPYTVTASLPATIAVNAHGAPSQTLTVPVGAAAFGLFTADGSGAGQGAILNQDGSQNSALNPAAAGSVVALFGTGEGGLTPSTVSGGLVISTPFPAFVKPVQVTVGGQNAQVLYAGAAPFLPAGVDQIDVVIPAGTPPGAAAIAVSVGGSTAKTVTVAVK